MDVDAVADLYELPSERLLVFFARRTYDGEVALDLTFKRGRVERRALRRIGLEPPAINDDEIERIEQLAGVHQLRAAVAEALAGLESGQRQALSEGRLRRASPLTAAACRATTATAAWW